MRKWRVILGIGGYQRETLVFAQDQHSALAIARAQFPGAEVRSVVEVK